jgi:hypothetical protein
MAWHLQNGCRTVYVDGDQAEKGLMIREIGSSERDLDENGFCIQKG